MRCLLGADEVGYRSLLAGDAAGGRFLAFADN